MLCNLCPIPFQHYGNKICFKLIYINKKRLLLRLIYNNIKSYISSRSLIGLPVITVM